MPRLPHPWFVTAQPGDPEAELARKVASLRQIVASGFTRRHEFPTGSPQRERSRAVTRAAIRGCRALMATPVEPDIPPPDDPAAVVALDVAQTPFLLRQAMSARFALSMLRDVQGDLLASGTPPDGVCHALDAAIPVTNLAVSTLLAAASDMPDAARGIDCSRVELIVVGNVDRPGIRLVFYRDDAMVGQVVVPQIATADDINRIVDGFMGAWSRCR
jgi:hypothetical protein